MLLTRSPLRHTSGLPLRYASLDLHALGTPPAFILSQDQTLQRTFQQPATRAGRVRVNEVFAIGSGTCERPQSLIACTTFTRADDQLRVSVVFRCSLEVDFTT